MINTRLVRVFPPQNGERQPTTAANDCPSITECIAIAWGGQTMIGNLICVCKSSSFLDGIGYRINNEMIPH